MTELQELNEKIARFSGFTLGYRHSILACVDIKDVWYSPDSTECGKKPPDFTDPIQGLGLLDKYPIRKLRDRYGVIRVSISYLDDGMWVKIEHMKNRSLGWQDLSYGTDKSPTIALCKAVEKLIDKEG